MAAAAAAQDLGAESVGAPDFARGGSGSRARKRWHRPQHTTAWKGSSALSATRSWYPRPRFLHTFPCFTGVVLREEAVTTKETLVPAVLVTRESVRVGGAVGGRVGENGGRRGIAGGGEASAWTISSWPSRALWRNSHTKDTSWRGNLWL